MTTCIQMRNRVIDRGRILFLVSGLIVCILAYLFGDRFFGSFPSVPLIIIFSSMAVILVIVMLSMGDPESIPPGESWRSASAWRRETRRRIIRCGLLCFACILISALVAVADSVPEMERPVMATATSIFFWCLAIPKIIINISVERMTAEVERRKALSKFKYDDQIGT